MTHLAITVLGHDRPGIIAQTAAALAAAGMNLEDSTMTLLRGHFAMTLICSGAADRGQVETALQPLVDGGLTISVLELPAEDALGPVGQSLLVTVHGADRLGIVSRLSGVVADAGGNITDLTTRLSAGLYVLAAEVDLPAGADADALTDALTDASAELGVETSVRALVRDDL